MYKHVSIYVCAVLPEKINTNIDIHTNIHMYTLGFYSQKCTSRLVSRRSLGTLLRGTFFVLQLSPRLSPNSLKTFSDSVSLT